MNQVNDLKPGCMYVNPNIFVMQWPPVLPGGTVYMEIWKIVLHANESKYGIKNAIL